jgi:hypothetical protein
VKLPWIACASLLLADAAAAAPPMDTKAAAEAAAPAASDPLARRVVALVDAGLLQPLAAREKRHSRFSRAPPPPRQRAARVPAAVRQHDATGAAFVAFAVDALYRGEAWQRDTMTGCAYVDDGRVFVVVGESAWPPALFTGGEGVEDAVACKPGPPAAATSSPPATAPPATASPTDERG